jgi:peptidoglycan/LPS O-acetylase OafA/YrhL
MLVDIAIAFGFAVVLAAVFAWLFHHFVDNPKIRRLEKENQILKRAAEENKKLTEGAMTFANFA